MTKQKATTKLSQISGKAVGRNVILVVDEEKHSKAFPEKDDREKILALVDMYNKKPTKKGLNAILELMLKETATTGKAKVEAKVEEIKKSAKKETPKKVDAKAEEIAKAKKMLEADGYTVVKKQPVTHRGRNREY